MSIRLVVPGPGPIAWVSKSRGERAAEQLARPRVSPERAAEARHEARFNRIWVLVGCVAVPSFGINGAVALWWMVPLVLFALLWHVVGRAAERNASPVELAFAQATREIHARRPEMGPEGCTWCGSVASHRAAGRPVFAHEFHRDDMRRAIMARTREILGA